MGKCASHRMDGSAISTPVALAEAPARVWSLRRALRGVGQAVWPDVPEPLSEAHLARMARRAVGVCALIALINCLLIAIARADLPKAPFRTFMALNLSAHALHIGINLW